MAATTRVSLRSTPGYDRLRHGLTGPRPDRLDRARDICAGIILPAEIRISLAGGTLPAWSAIAAASFPGGTYFFTVTLADRTASLLTDRIDALGAAFRHCRAAHPFETLAIVVLPEHLHCIWTLPDGDAEYAIRWSLIKRAFTRRQYHQGPTPARDEASGLATPLLGTHHP